MTNETCSNGLCSSTNKYNEILRPRASGEIDLVDIMRQHIAASVGVNESITFINDPMVHSVKNSNSSMQRVILNRYFSGLLYKFRSAHTVNITDVLYYLINDGVTEDWIDLQVHSLLPFLKNNDVINLVGGSM